MLPNTKKQNILEVTENNNTLKRENETTKKSDENMKILNSLYKIIFNLNEGNIELSIQQTMKLFDNNLPLSFNFVISDLIYFSFCSQKNNINFLISYLEIIQTKEEEITNNKIIETFVEHISKFKTHEAYYLIEKMIERNLIDVNITKKIDSPYFAHYKSNIEIMNLQFTLFLKQFEKNREKLSKNDWELHKQLIEEGVNPNEIAKIIRKDEILKLQEISSQSNFDFNQEIEPSLYERCSFVNKYNVRLIDYAAFFGSVKCFKYLLMNGANIINAGKYAIACGNEEIIHLCEQNHSSFDKAYETAIEFHQNDVFKYVYEKKFEEKHDDIMKFCVSYGNYEIISFLENEEGTKAGENAINEAAKIGNLYLIKHFLQNNQIPNDILVFASLSGNTEVVQYILEQKGIDINAKDREGETALIKASVNGYKEIVQLLLEQDGIDINAQENRGNTAFFLASTNQRIEIVKLFLKQKGFDINAKNENGFTPLMLACFMNLPEVVKLFLEQEGIDINAENFYLSYRIFS